MPVEMTTLVRSQSLLNKWKRSAPLGNITPSEFAMKMAMEK
jgi:hypothetical protein